MSDFKRIGAMENGAQICLENEWDYPVEYYFITDKKYDEDRIFLEDDDRKNIYEFLFIDELNRLIFRHLKNDFLLVIDPLKDNTRNNVSILSFDKINIEENQECIFAEKKEWFKVEDMIFDVNFFKVRHPYQVRWICGSSCYTYAILAKMTVSYLVFVYVDSSGKACDYVVTKKMYETRDPSHCFRAISPEDKWTHELEKPLEENNEQEAKEETENDEKKPRKKTAKKVHRNNKKTVEET